MRYYILSLFVLCTLVVLGTSQDCVNCDFPMMEDVDGLCALTVCSVGQYASSATTCQNCPTGCATCTSSSSCQSCTSGYTLEGSSCLLPTIASRSSAWVVPAAVGSTLGVAFVGLVVYLFKSKFLSAALKSRKLFVKRAKIAPESPSVSPNTRIGHPGSPGLPELHVETIH